MKNMDVVSEYFYTAGYNNSDTELIKNLKSKNLKEIISWLKYNNAQIKEVAFPKIANDFNDIILANNKINVSELTLLKELNQINFQIKGFISATEKQLYAFSSEIFYMIHNHYPKAEILEKYSCFCFDAFLDENGVDIEESIFHFTNSIQKLKSGFGSSKQKITEQLIVLKSLIHNKYIIEQEILLPRLLKFRKEII